MAVVEYPETGVLINQVSLRRVRSNYREALTIWLMRFRGESKDLIASQMGLPSIEVWKVTKRKVHPDAYTEAWHIFLSSQQRGYRQRPAARADRRTAPRQARLPGL